MTRRPSLPYWTLISLAPPGWFALCPRICVSSALTPSAGRLSLNGPRHSMLLIASPKPSKPSASRSLSDDSHHLAQTQAALESLNHEAIDRAGTTLVKGLAGGVIYTCGNGGSAAEALHLVEEVIGAMATVRRPSRSVFECRLHHPDVHRQRVWLRKRLSRQLEARPEDVLIVLSTSGESRTSSTPCKLLVTLEPKRSACWAVADQPPNCATPACWFQSMTAAIQEAHLAMVHCLCAAIEHHTPIPGDHA